VQAANEFADFAAAFGATNLLVREAEARWVLELGAEHWPFPVPIVQTMKAYNPDETWTVSPN
jgi:hypothetical protein